MNEKSPPHQPRLRSFSVYRRIGVMWVFWMNARGQSIKQLHQAVWWRNKGKVRKEDIRVTE